MKEQHGVLNDMAEGFTSGFPVVLGYFPVAMAFGLFSKSVNVSLRDSFLFSLMVFAGASQFMALDMIKAGTAAVNIVLSTFLLNLRHLMMSASISLKLRKIKRKWLIFIAFGITDETFSITSFGNRELTIPFLLSLQGVSYASWVLGTVAGYLAGTVIPPSVQSSLGIGLYAMFAALLTPEIKKSVPVLILSVFSMIIYALISVFNIVPNSWRLIATVIIAAAAGVLFLKDDIREVEG